VNLQEKTEVEVLMPGGAEDNDDPTGGKTPGNFIGMWKDALGPEGDQRLGLP